MIFEVAGIIFRVSSGFTFLVSLLCLIKGSGYTYIYLTESLLGFLFAFRLLFSSSEQVD